MQCSSPPSQLIDKEYLIIVTLIADAHNRSPTTGRGRKRGKGLYTRDVHGGAAAAAVAVAVRQRQLPKKENFKNS